MSTKDTFRGWTLWMAWIALAILVATPALAQHGGRGGHGHHPGHRDHAGHSMMKGMGHAPLFEHLDLTEDQRQQIREIHEQQKDAMAGTQEQLRSARRELFDRIHAAVMDETAIRDASAVVAAIEVDIAVARAKTAQRVRTVLTPEQQAKAAEMHQHHRDMADKRHRDGF